MNRLQRTTGTVAGLLTTAFAVAALAAAPANADDANTLTVVGTSDVFDSGLVQSVIKPDFEAANPGVTLNYISRGTGAALALARTGAASAAIVHAASLENQFVADGYSLESYGRAVFWGDYVLLGPTSDPAGVLTNAPDDISTAFERVAAAGAAGNADFVSRGGTPGTTVQEHAIWATTSGVQTCTVPDASGGGKSPTDGTGTCGSSGFPSWYHATGLTQGPNVLAGSTCNFPNASNGNDCYVFTDRGTFQYLQSTGQAQNLKIVTRATSATAPAKQDLLVNSFHAYGVNPGKFSGSTAAGINTVLATKFLNFLTSPTEQQAIGSYLSADPPFIPSAAPKVTLKSTLPTTVSAGTQLTVKGNLKNAVPGTPALSGVTVSLVATPTGGNPSVVATAGTNRTGDFTLKSTATRNATYTVTTDQITKIERPDLSPVFGDLLAPSSTTVGTVSVASKVTVTSATPSSDGKSIQLSGTVSPAASNGTAQIQVYAAPKGQTPSPVSTQTLPNGATTFSVTYTPGAPGVYQYRLFYVNTGVIDTSSTKLYTFRSQ